VTSVVSFVTFIVFFKTNTGYRELPLAYSFHIILLSVYCMMRFDFAGQWAIMKYFVLLFKIDTYRLLLQLHSVRHHLSLLIHYIKMSK